MSNESPDVVLIKKNTKKVKKNKIKAITLFFFKFNYTIKKNEKLYVLHITVSS